MSEHHEQILFQIDHEAACANNAAAHARNSPHVIYGARVTQDGNQWLALVGDDLATGVVGCGDSPAAACAAFDRAWLTGRS